MKFELMDNSGNANIKVIGVGGGGGNAVNHMLKQVSMVCSSFAPIPMLKPCVK